MPLKNVSLTGNPAQPYDLQAQQMSLAQQAAIANALIAQSLERTSPIIHTGGGNPFARDIPNFGDPISKVVQAMIGKQKQDEANAGMNELNLETQRRTGAEMDAITRRQFGIESSGMAPMEGQPGYLQGTPDPVGAARLGQQATTPRAQALGAEIRKGFLSPEEAYKGLQNFESKSVADALRTQDLSKIIGRPKVTVEGDKAITSTDGAVTGVQPVDRFTDLQTDPNTGLPYSKSLVTNKQYPATGGNIATSRAKEIKEADATIDELKKGREGYIKDVSSMGHLAQAEYELSKTPENALGMLSWFKTNMSKLGELIGANKLDSTASIEQIRSTLGNLSLEKARIVAPVSDNDWEKIREIMGTEANTKRALEGIIRVMQTATARNLGVYRDFVRSTAKDPDIAKNPDAFLQKWAPDFRIDPVQTPAEGAPLRYDKQGNPIG